MSWGAFDARACSRRIGLSDSPARPPFLLRSLCAKRRLTGPPGRSRRRYAHDDQTQCTRRRSDRAHHRAQPHVAPGLPCADRRRGRQADRPANASVAPISPMASPPARRATKRRCARGPGPISRSSPPTTTCFRPTSPTRAFPISSRRRRARRAARRRSRAAFRRCATASPRARRAWSFPCSRAMSLRSRRRSPFRMTCSTRRSISASATRSCRAS